MAGSGLFVDIAAAFAPSLENAIEKEQACREKMKDQGGGTNPSVLAEYQAAVSELSILYNAQSSAIKTFKDIDSTIVANYR